MPASEPGWIVVRCPACAGLVKCDPSKLGAAPTCPSCGTVLVLPDASSPRQGGRVPKELVSNIPKPKPSEPLDGSRVKQTTDEDLVSIATERIRVKRKSERVEKQLTSWEQAPGETDPATRNRPVPKWLKLTKVAALSAVPIALLCLTVYGVIASLKQREEVYPSEEDGEAIELQLSELEAASLDHAERHRVYARARTVAELFLSAKTWQERLPLCRHPDRVRPLMEEYYSHPAHPDGPFTHRELPDDARVIVDKSLMLLSIEMEDLSHRPLAIERLPDDRYLVDWESWVGYCEIPWDEIRQRRSTLPFRLRARILRRDYYNHGFQDDRWISWQLEDRTGQHRIFGYVEPEDPIMLNLLEAARSQGSMRPVHVLIEVRFPQDAPAGDQVEITRFVTLGWVDAGRDVQ